MRALLIATAASFAAVLATTGPANAERPGHGSPPGMASAPKHTSFGDASRHDRRRHNNFDDSAFFYDYYREYQGDTVWKSDSFNDWWHDRPDRAYPRWVQNNQNCERKWWGGDTLRC